MKRPALGLWVALALALTALCAGLNVGLRLNAESARVGGARLPLFGQDDIALHRIDDHRAFLITPSGAISVVRVKFGPPPLRPVCGQHVVSGGLLNLAQFQSGDWVYSGYPELPGVDAYNLRTDESVALDVPAPPPGRSVDPAKVPFYREHGLTFAASARLDPQRVAAQHPAIPAIQEGCVTVNAAFAILYGFMALWGLWLAVGLWRARKPSP
ncbi:MAG: hypothetical protein H6739_42030 [Alphaproteobacteria bacterium]|nr:hypothetical protein [Alphaproteobacteria bacterium]